MNNMYKGGLIDGHIHLNKTIAGTRRRFELRRTYIVLDIVEMDDSRHEENTQL